MWRLFPFDETAGPIASNVLWLKECAQMLRYNNGQVLELLKNTLQTRYYYLLFGIQNHREIVEGAKRVMTMEKTGKCITSSKF